MRWTETRPSLSSHQQVDVYDTANTEVEISEKAALTARIWKKKEKNPLLMKELIN